MRRFLAVVVIAVVDRNGLDMKKIRLMRKVVSFIKTASCNLSLRSSSFKVSRLGFANDYSNDMSLATQERVVVYKL